MADNELLIFQRDFIKAILDERSEEIFSFIREQDRERFNIYRNNVYYALGSSLASSYPITRRIVGAEFFLYLTSAYIRNNIPTSPSLISYGKSFPRFIETFEACASIPYLADFCRLERAWLEALSARDAPSLSVKDFAGILSFDLHPATRLVMSDYPIFSIWQHQQAESPSTEAPPIDLVPECVLITRKSEVVKVSNINADQANIVKLFFVNKGNIGSINWRKNLQSQDNFLRLLDVGTFENVDKGKPS
ncbi:HvfC/BufC family peptide modification chaperone [Thalassospira xiamenensis]|uniref:DNA-binding domain-containing protein n=1 Tax=Thalassospira xiamenensis TaxID=220697 RepID=A0A285TY43_9PROT|nr:putative DNA-binding domain-containing protein [Thalassospira xiamenensis]SOC31034.1 Putative DNA-binding domain-containing protein [Thalassospira xiamenensis]